MSASITKSDISGSQLTVAYKDYNKDSAIRRFFVDADPADTKADVINAVYGAIGLLHNELTSLPLQTLTATRIGIGKWLVIARYDRSVTTSLPIAASSLVDTQTAYEAMPIYTDYSTFSNGVPLGAVLCPASEITDATKRSSVERKVWQRPVLRMKWPFATGIHPAVNYRNAAGTLNTSQILVSGQAFAPQTVRYDGFVCDSRATTAGARYYGYHALTYATDSAWQAQELYYDSQWRVRLVKMYTVGSWTLT